MPEAAGNAMNSARRRQAGQAGAGGESAGCAGARAGFEIPPKQRPKRQAGLAILELCVARGVTGSIKPVNGSIDPDPI